MIDKDPTNYPLLTYLWVAGLSILGGLVSHLNKINNGTPFTFLRFVTDILTSGFVGVITFFLCESAGFDPVVTAACVAVSGHMGSRILFVFERWVKAKIDAMTKL